MKTTHPYPPPAPKQTPKDKVIRDDKKVREEQSEQDIDKSLADSFPASDPPGRY